MYCSSNKKRKNWKTTLNPRQSSFCFAENGCLQSPKWQLKNISSLKSSTWQKWTEIIVQYSFGSSKRMFCHCLTGLCSGLSLNYNHSSRLPQSISSFRNQLSTQYLNSLFCCWFIGKGLCERKSRQIKLKLVIVLDVLKPAIVFQFTSAVGEPIKGTWTSENSRGQKCCGQAQG